MKKTFRIGQIVPSSNVTMETEIPALLRARESVGEERFTFHSSRMRMKHVTREELAAMDADSDRCALELSDARVDVMGYACLVAIMSMGHGYHCVSGSRLQQVTANNGAPTTVITSAGALIEGLKAIGARRVAVVAPYMKPLTEMVVGYIRHEGIEVSDYRALEIQDNLAVAAHDPMNLPDIVADMNTDDVDAVVLSACVQMPSLSAVTIVEARTGKPVVTAAIATTWQMLKALHIETRVPGGGTLLSGAY
ncbi:Maleate isomerase [Klebsiella pneumoniae]|uniref:Maleate isomerase n=2 Tax=Klebsiella TaxID=570 RepID=A0A2J4ZWT0_9ENTR|nr:Asp/Glu racemase [Klebsiella michiganensis]CED73432.1 Maleate isomerase [Klebsiella pneumoniae]VGE58678.1 Arylmalonate decarboxylase [Klebsiella quasipneumoniae]HBV2578829.1 Asp/Glu racemase [Klebsiella pneumoniae]HBV2661981.1 Asp/Glu racemase [Klebsiella pneumoniae]